MGHHHKKTFWNSIKSGITSKKTWTTVGNGITSKKTWAAVGQGTKVIGNGVVSVASKVGQAEGSLIKGVVGSSSGFLTEILLIGGGCVVVYFVITSSSKK